MVGTRFHGVIFALTGYVPSIAIEYEHKTRGIMHDLGLDQWIISMTSVTAAKLKTMFDQLLRERDAYSEQLHAELPKYLKRATIARDRTRETYTHLTSPQERSSAR
jgi:colanic acid/amylovoran biosynthesis protein